jgi:hypothetical protein
MCNDPKMSITSHACHSHCLQWHGRLDKRQLITWIHNRTANPAESFVEGYPTVNCMVIRQFLGQGSEISKCATNQSTPIRDLFRANKRVDLYRAFVPLEYLQHEDVSRLLNSTIPE